MKKGYLLICLCLTYLYFGLSSAQVCTTTTGSDLNCEDQGITSPTHEAYMGQIVFSKELISFQNEDPNQFTNSFNAGDSIYARHYLPASIWKLLDRSDGNQDTSYAVRVYIDGRLRYGYAADWCDDECTATWTTWQLNFDEVPDLDFVGDSVQDAWKSLVRACPILFYAEGVNPRYEDRPDETYSLAMLNGPHEISVEFWVFDRPVAKGSFTYNADPNYYGECL